MNEPFDTHKDRVAIPPQGEKFIEAARALGCDEDEARWDERLRKVAGQKAGPQSGEGKRGD